MAKSRSDRAKRDSSHIPRDSLLRGVSDSLPSPEPSFGSLFSPSPTPRLFHVEQVSGPGLLSEVQDGRAWRPDASRRWGAPQRLLGGQPARLEARPPPAPFGQVAFQTPQQVIPCVRRQQRKEVLHALKRTGKGSGGGRKHRTPESNIRCK